MGLAQRTDPVQGGSRGRRDRPQPRRRQERLVQGARRAVVEFVRAGGDRRQRRQGRQAHQHRNNQDITACRAGEAVRAIDAAETLTHGLDRWRWTVVVPLRHCPPPGNDQLGSLSANGVNDEWPYRQRCGGPFVGKWSDENLLTGQKRRAICLANFPTVIDPTCNRAHVLCQDGVDGTAAVLRPPAGRGGGRHSPAGL
jgi:hypothetical protein